jgi:hypothetical protein
MSAWPHCSNATAHQQCALHRASDEGYACLKEARLLASQAEKNRLALADLNKAESAVRTAASTWSDIKEAWNDPARFAKEKLSGHVRNELLESLRDQRGQFTQRGTTTMQETYDFLFNRTIGNSSAYASNPVVGAIQGAAADEIRRAHSQSIAQMEQLTRTMADISIPKSWQASPPSRVANPAPQARQSEPADCALLDGQAGANLAIDAPDKFEDLLRRCGRSGGR